VRLLLDSQALYWAVKEPHKLRPATIDAIADPLNVVLYSAVNLWELAIKRAKGKFNFNAAAVLDAIERQDFTELPITTHHGLEAASLPLTTRTLSTVC
jgi:PIN domain nuclease of toxin-antitoxin system